MKNSIILLFIAISINSYAQQLTKEDAVSYTLENNHGITIVNNNINAAKNNTSILNTGYLPTLTGSAGATYQNQSSNTSFPDTFDEDGLPVPDILSLIHI